MLTGTETKEDIKQINLIHQVFDASQNDDEDEFTNAVIDLADLRNENICTVLFKLFQGLDVENKKLVKLI